MRILQVSSSNKFNKEKIPLFFDKINIELKYYNYQNENIVHEYHDHIYKLLKNHKFKFPIKITTFTENLVYDIDYDLQSCRIYIRTIARKIS